MAIIKKMLKARVHLGHYLGEWNPKMFPYIYGKLRGVHIIDIVRTIVYLKRAINFLKKSTKNGKSFDFN